MTAAVSSMGSPSPNVLRAPESGAPLGIALALRGTLRAQVQEGGQAVSFVNEAGAAALTYGGLKVWDADGRTLPARMGGHERNRPAV